MTTHIKTKGVIDALHKWLPADAKINKASGSADGTEYTVEIPSATLLFNVYIYLINGGVGCGVYEKSSWIEYKEV